MTCYGAMQGIEGLRGLTPSLQYERAKVTAALQNLRITYNLFELSFCYTAVGLQ